ncbi:MAG: export ABC transporter ATP-binding protein [Candidatus Thermofonsia Clade 1 bacterium]|jgi:ABC-2 type transport system ATP-binding protein|uniref:Export ABC transporter ATP-binding protein n=1 Tax=Candidatus Thermofonsia Clade 1 bacterium TaxID=2364210 RepID=A0A2M8PF91_9CHLR|nr:MAG: export ABC transporter ATP-binding protein [Candidatus Thermofonsia Clade 1 bacterium]RMF50994.1 MAG: ABC transporter ATP-binding protein [Chloroflexota bacterium]
MTPFVTIQNLTKRYPPRNGKGEGILAVKNLSLTIERGEIFSLLGPNGAGKTTTINMMSGLLEPTSGEVIIGGYAITKNPLAVKKLIGVVPQEIALYPELSARANLEFFGKLQGLRGEELAKRCDEVLEFIGLRDRQRERIETFSGGMKRRVNIAVGLLHKPSLVFMDEPTVGVDPQSRRNILEAVKQLNQQGMTVLYTTHYMEEAQELSDRVGIMDHGELIACGKQIDLIQQTKVRDAIVLKFLPEQVAQAQSILRDLPFITDLECEGDLGEKLRILSDHGRQALPHIIRALDDHNLIPSAIQIVEPNLEMVFLQLTGRALRD